MIPVAWRSLPALLAALCAAAPVFAQFAPAAGGERKWRAHRAVE